MFTGIVETLGHVKAVQPDAAGRTLTITSSLIAQDSPIGASVAINGVCLTVVVADADSLTFQAGPETLRLTNLAGLRPGDPVNLERPLKVGDRLGGHIVQGHVDGMGRIASRHPEKDWETVWFTAARELTDQMIKKGSVAIDGISLTLVDVESGRFSVALIPHTLAVTTLGTKQVGATVNLETDMFGKYIRNYLAQLSMTSHASLTAEPPGNAESQCRES